MNKQHLYEDHQESFSINGAPPKNPPSLSKVFLIDDKAKEVMDGVNKGTYDHSLLSEWKDVFSYGKNHHNETLLGIDYNSNFGGWQEWDSQLSSCHQSGKFFNNDLSSIVDDEQIRSASSSNERPIRLNPTITRCK